MVDKSYLHQVKHLDPNITLPHICQINLVQLTRIQLVIRSPRFVAQRFVEKLSNNRNTVLLDIFVINGI